MREGQNDFALLQAFVRRGEQAAFAELVQRHLDLVYATAFHKVLEQGAAQEIAQNVFLVLSRKAWQFALEDSLPSWLHKTTLLKTKEWLRGELRRRRREQTAVELGTTMNAPEDQPALRTLVPLLDEALLSLREKERAALLLRFYEKQSLRQVGAALGVG
jgi:RNA polymerase sigma factor (sigma-70 family)